MDYSLEHHKNYIGKPISALPTPSLIVSLPVVKQNIATLHNDVESLGIRFRPHVKTLKVCFLLTMGTVLFRDTFVDHDSTSG